MRGNGVLKLGEVYDMSSSARTDGRPEGEQFGITEARVGRDRTLPRNVKLVYTYLTYFADKDRRCYPGTEVMAEELGMSRALITAAIQIGKDCGLWTVERPKNRNYVYQLHDRSWGPTPYVVGSGPGEKAKGAARGKPFVEKGACAETAQELAQNQRESCAESAQYQDQLTGPETKTSHASSGDAYQRVVENKFSTESERAHAKPIRIFTPKGFERWDDGRAMQYIVGSAVAALESAGLTPSKRTADNIGHMFRHNLDAGCTRRIIIEHIQKELNAAVSGDPQYAWMLADHTAAETSDPWAS